MNEEKKLAQKAYMEMLNAMDESYVKSIYASYLNLIRANKLDEQNFIKHLKILFSKTEEAQCPEQTNKNTIAAQALLQRSKK